MKIKNLILCTTLSLSAFGIWSCKKDASSATNDDIETTFELSGNEAVTENMSEDANDILMEASVENNFSGRNSETSSIQTMNDLSCATVTVTPLQGFPKNISIDFGAGCTSTNGITRKGKIVVVVSDSLRKAGSVSTMNFVNYYVGGFKLEGTLTWTNTSQGNIKSWERTCTNGKITSIDGRYWLHSGTIEIVQTDGVSTKNNLLDDVYSITGQHVIINAKGASGTSTVTAPLELKVSCENVDKGAIKFESASHVAVVDFGDGTCDHIATISIDGNTPRTVLLR